MIRLLVVAALGWATPAPAGRGQGAAMPGMAMPMPARTAPRAAPAPPPCPPAHAALGHCPPADPPAAPAAPLGPARPVPPAGTALPAGTAAPPAPPTDRAADRFYAPAAMARASAAMRHDHGGMAFAQLLFNLAEVQVRGGRTGPRWDAEGWYGGDIHRLVVKSEGEATFGEPLDGADLQLLYSRAITPYFDLQAGLRRTVGTGPDRTDAMIGIEGLAPYWFEVEAAAFLSDRGDLRARIELWYDQRLTQRLILQPRIETALAARDMPANRIGSGLSAIEAGLRLRYELRRELAPYVGLAWDRRFGDTARLARAAGDRAGGVAVVAGLRTWF